MAFLFTNKGKFESTKWKKSHYIKHQGIIVKELPEDNEPAKVSRKLKANLNMLWLDVWPFKDDIDLEKNNKAYQLTYTEWTNRQNVDCSHLYKEIATWHMCFKEEETNISDLWVVDYQTKTFEKIR